MDIRQSDPDLESIARRLLNREIELQPDFQRQEVWSRSKKQKLIDTILRGWAIPPVHLVQNEYSEDVLDGQQRLTAIRDFVAGKFPVNGGVAPDNTDIKPLDGLYYEELPLRTRRKFDRYTLRVYTLLHAHPQETAELFYRLNQPTALTSGEQRNALYGIRRTQMKRIVSNMDDLGYNVRSIGFSNSRLAYDDVIARTLIVFERGGLREKIGEAEISIAFRSETPFESKLTESISLALTLISAAFAYGPLKLNKASLFSFLVAFARNNEFQPVHYVRAMGLLSRDVSNTSEVRPDHQVYREVFLDRASSRVTDTTSVVLRDFCAVQTLNLITGEEITKREPILLKLNQQIGGDILFDEFDTESLSRRVIESKWGASI